MSIVSSAICDISRRPAPLTAVAIRSVAGPTQRPGIRAYPLPITCRAASLHGDPAAGWQVREDTDEYDIPDLLFEPDPELLDAAEAHTEEQREAMGLLDDVNGQN